MKSFTILIGILFLGTISNGQITKGTVQLGGSISSSSNDTKYDYAAPNVNSSYEAISKSTSVNLSISKAFKDNVVYGISLGFAPSSSNNNNYKGDYNISHTNAYSTGVFIRKYNKIIDGLYLFNQMGIGFSYTQNKSKISNTSPTEVSNSNVGNISFSPGIAYRIYQNIDFELTVPSLVSLNYINNRTALPYSNPAQSNHNNSFGLSSSLNFSSIALGVRIILKK